MVPKMEKRSLFMAFKIQSLQITVVPSIVEAFVVHKTAMKKRLEMIATNAVHQALTITFVESITRLVF